MASIAAVYGRILAREMIRLGQSETELFQGTNLSYRGLWQHSEIQMPSFIQLLKNAEQLPASEPVGFIIGNRQTTLALGRLGVALGSAPTVRDGLRVLESYTGLQVSYVRIELVTRLSGASVRLHLLDDLGDTLVHHAETTMMMLQHYLELISGERLDDAECCFSYSQPAHSHKYADYLHSPCRFDQAEIAMNIPRRWLDISSPYYHNELWQQSLMQLTQRMQELKSNHESVYSRHILALLRSYEPPLPSLGDMAHRLHLSERTLNRRLGEESSSFRDLRGQILNEWAQQHLLETDASVEAIAATLGYQDAANFRRAFKTRSGLTPGEYRANPSRAILPAAMENPQ